MNLINTKSYVELFLDLELEYENEIKLVDDYNKIVQKCNRQADKLEEYQALIEDAKKLGDAYIAVVE